MAALAAALARRQTGSALGDQTSSASQILSSLAPVLAYAALFAALFLVFRRWYPILYTPRTFSSAIPPQERSPPAPTGGRLWDWFAAYARVPDSVVLNRQQTLDGFLFLRLLRLSVVYCLVGCAITFPILLPINATGSGGQAQFGILTWSNVASPAHPDSYYKYFAHATCAWIFFAFLVYGITRESLYFISLRQAYLVSPLYSKRVSSRTVLFMSVPRKYLDEDVLRELLGRDQVKHVWIPLDTDELESKVNERDQLLLKLENAEVKLIKDANRARDKAIKEGDAIPLNDNRSADHGDESGSVAAHWLKRDRRPTHRLGFMGLWGDKVDTIDWCRGKLPESLESVSRMQAEHKAFKGKTRNSVFVQFHTLQDAQSAYQSLTHHEPLHMAPRYIGVSPDEIIWYNLRIRWWERVIRTLAAIGLAVAIVVGWSVPTAFIASISNLDTLVQLRPFQWLSWITRLGKLSGIITGLLPSILLSIVVSTLPPILLRLLARLGGDPSLSVVEYTLQNSYFWFYVVQGFLVTTLSSGAIQAAASILQNPAEVVSLLANSLPNASNFYLSYFIVQGLGVVSNLLLNLTGVVLYVVLSKLFDGTPRKKFMRFLNLTVPQLGSFYPVNTTLLVMAISYSCVAPLVLGFAAIGLYFYYLAYRYNFIYCYQVRFDTKGLMYARALQQIFVGVYIAQLCMIGLFAIKLGESAKLLGPFIMMIVSLVCTALYHYSLNMALRPLLAYLPKTLETEERRLLAAEEDESDVDVEDRAGASSDQDSPRMKGMRFDGQGEVERRGGAGLQPSMRYVAEKVGKTIAQPFEGIRGDGEVPQSRSATGATSPERPRRAKPGAFAKWLRPDVYHDYHTLRRAVPRGAAFDVEISPEDEREAYFHAAVRSEPSVIWLPRDAAGVSAQEARHTSRVTPCTDAGASLGANGRIDWDSARAADAPIYERRVYY